jgi:hypothetical protein
MLSSSILPSPLFISIMRYDNATPPPPPPSLALGYLLLLALATKRILPATLRSRSPQTTIQPISPSSFAKKATPTPKGNHYLPSLSDSNVPRMFLTKSLHNPDSTGRRSV